MPGLACRARHSLPAGNEGAGVVVARVGGRGTGADGQDRRGARRRHVLAISCRRSRAMPVAARQARRRPMAPRRSSIRSPRSAWSRRCGARATRRSCTPRPLRTSARCCSASASPTASGLVNIVRKPDKQTCCARWAPPMCATRARPPSCRPHRGARRHRRDDRLRRHGRRQAGRPDPRLHGGRAEQRTAKDYSRYGSTTYKQVYIYGGLDREPDRVQSQLRHGLGHRRLAAHAVPAEDRPAGAQTLKHRVAGRD